jgi:hypothetical protein
MSPQPFSQLVVSVLFGPGRFFGEYVDLNLGMVVRDGHFVFDKGLNIFALLFGKRAQTILVEIVSFVDVFMVEFSHSRIGKEIT